jgi:hypothetical protein
MKLYYCSKMTEETHAILRDGFINDSEYKGISGIYLVDAPAAQPGEQLLEISLPAEIDISPFEIFAPGAPWREWCVPVGIINQYGKTRQLSGDERDQAQFERIIEVRNELVAEGLLEQAKDSQGQLIYRNGKPAYRITEKGRASLEW